MATKIFAKKYFEDDHFRDAYKFRDENILHQQKYFATNVFANNFFDVKVA